MKINLDRSPHRLEQMKKILNKYGFERITRINGIDGKKVSKKSELPTRSYEYYYVIYIYFVYKLV